MGVETEQQRIASPTGATTAAQAEALPRSRRSFLVSAVSLGLCSEKHLTVIVRERGREAV